MNQPNTAPHSHVTDENFPNRLALVGPQHVTALAFPQTYGDNDVMRLRRRMTYDGLPTELSTDEVQTFAGLVSEATKQVSPGENGHRMEVRALRWLGGISYLRSDLATAAHVADTLWHNEGLRGKMAAMSLWYEQNIQA